MLFLAGLCLSGNGFAQTDMSKWKVGLFPGILHYQGEPGTEFFHFKQGSAAVAVGVGRVLNSSFDVEAAAMGGNLDYVYPDSAQGELETSVFDVNAQLIYKFNNGYILREDFPVSPFLLVGGGVMASDFGVAPAATLGGGINFRFDELFSMQLRSQWKPNTQKEFNMVQTSLGFVFTLLKKGEKAEKVEDATENDRDHDGVADLVDKCPDVAGVEANGGCPEVDEESKNVMMEALRGIQFETGKDVIKTESYSILDNVADIMRRHPEYKLSIEGHTDSQGDDNMNLDLSKRRAKAAMQYLVGKGVDASRMRSEGYGETNPIDTNDTPEGRARNRRVEFNIEF